MRDREDERVWKTLLLEPCSLNTTATDVSLSGNQIARLDRMFLSDFQLIVVGQMSGRRGLSVRGSVGGLSVGVSVGGVSRDGFFTGVLTLLSGDTRPGVALTRFFAFLPDDPVFALLPDAPFFTFLPGAPVFTFLPDPPLLSLLPGASSSSLLPGANFSTFLTDFPLVSFPPLPFSSLLSAPFLSLLSAPFLSFLPPPPNLYYRVPTSPLS